MAEVTLLYFASLRDTAGVASEKVATQATDLAGVYAEAAQRHALHWPAQRLRVAVDGEFARWSDAVRAGSEIAFIPPVSGG